MPEHTIAIAPIPLARATGRMLVVPLVLLLAGAAAVGGGVSIGGLVGIGLVAAGLVVAVLSLYLAAMLLTVRLDVEVATLRLRWLWGERRYILVRGAVTRGRCRATRRPGCARASEPWVGPWVAPGCAAARSSTSCAWRRRPP